LLEARIAGPLSIRQEGYIQDIRESGEQLLDLIGDVIDLSSVELGRLTLQPAQLNLAALMGDCSRLVAYRVEQAGLTIKMGDFSEFPNVKWDKRRIKQVILNLLTNAIKFTPPGGHITIEGGAAGPDKCRFTISDTGIGMSRQDLEYVVNPFHQGMTAISRKQKITGLDESGVSAAHYRKGGYGGYREELPPKVIADINHRYENLLLRWGYALD
jgi:signal transduction histidine kinase